MPALEFGTFGSRGCSLDDDGPRCAEMISSTLEGCFAVVSRLTGTTAGIEECPETGKARFGLLLVNDDREPELVLVEDGLRITASALPLPLASFVDVVRVVSTNTISRCFRPSSSRVNPSCVNSSVGKARRTVRRKAVFSVCYA